MQQDRLCHSFKNFLAKHVFRTRDLKPSERSIFNPRDCCEKCGACCPHNHNLAAQLLHPFRQVSQRFYLYPNKHNVFEINQYVKRHPNRFLARNSRGVKQGCVRKTSYFLTFCVSISQTVRDTSMVTVSD